MRLVILLVISTLLSACSNHSSVRVEPELLLNSSSEHVAFSITDSESVDSVLSWIKDDRPTEAQLVCVKNDMACTKLQSSLNDLEIPTRTIRSNDESNSASLIYHRVTARDCKARGFGCSVSVNIIQTVADHSHFTRPPLSGKKNAKKAVDSYERYIGR